MPRVTYFARMTAKRGKAKEFEDLLLTNHARTKEGEPGNLAFAVHRSTDDPDTSWLYETWESQEGVDDHESGSTFVQDKDELRPLIEGEVTVEGRDLMAAPSTAPWPPTTSSVTPPWTCPPAKR